TWLAIWLSSSLLVRDQEVGLRNAGQKVVASELGDRQSLMLFQPNDTVGHRPSRSASFETTSKRPWQDVDLAAPSITLNDAKAIPQLGFGVFQIPPDANSAGRDAAGRHPCARGGLSAH